MKNGLQKIKIDSKHKVKGFYALLTNGPVVCLPNNKYIVPNEAIPILKRKKIKFKTIES